MSREIFNLPDVGEGLTEAEILSWQVAVGDTVTVNQVIVEIETAKAAVELPSPYAGTVLELLASPGDTVNVGSPIIAIGDPATAEAPTPAPPTENPATSKPAAEPTSAEPAGAQPTGAEPAAGEPAAGEPTGAKIGEAGADGRIATLVGYGPRPGTVQRRARKSPRVDAPSTPSRQSQHTESTVSAHRVDAPGTPQAAAPATPEAPAPATSDAPAPSARPLAKPPVRKLAKDLGVDLSTLAGSGPGGSITRDDLNAGATPAGGTNGAVDTPVRPVAPGGGERREPIRGVRKATAAAMVSSAFTAPHVTEFLTVDVTPMLELRDRLRGTAEFRDVKLSPLVFAAKAVCLAARRTPDVNAHWDEDAQEIVYYDHVHLGIAAATPRGLVVPKIRHAQGMSLRELAEALAELTATARAGKTPPADMLGGTLSITNVGVFGVDTGTPILPPGEAAILALGAVKQAPWVVDGQLAVRTVCQLALSFDHRLVDGEQGSRFLADVGALLADPGRAITY
ncbi:dihydrolipoamide acetyltransferase family protein [Pseudonocardia eucalypti]|uniref:Dihydrolipoamide acetyltransferase component of pyruvate dehydrogenase complex n=1 Tax=Pseudonocardia eucalypti TaxID=648755 RepID=A0ABP9PE83_9PSEU|nr:pyruvate dehydrogenase E2 component (dihydrolipoamide acetyltransferase) [Pseudonocardia eucalypti]